MYAPPRGLTLGVWTKTQRQLKGVEGVAVEEGRKYIHLRSVAGTVSLPELNHVPFEEFDFEEFDKGVRKLLQIEITPEYLSRFSPRDIERFFAVPRTLRIAL